MFQSSLRLVYCVLIPFFILITAIFLSCIIAYFIVILSNNSLPLNQTISRLTQVLLVLSIFPALRLLHFNKQDLGFAERKVFGKQFIQGLLLGIITLLPVFILLYLLNVHVIDTSKVWTFSYLAKKMSLALLTAGLISFIEEPLFRGIILISLKQKTSVFIAVFFSAFYYALVHFLQNKTTIPANELNLFSSFQLAQQAFANLLNPSILSAFLALLMVGIFLAFLRLHFPVSLGLCIGCHTSWVWQIKMSKELFNTDFASPYAYLVSPYDGIIGGLVSLWLGLAILCYLFFQREKFS
jgi:membrane protease YdiL (CAAX protease family)